MTSNPNQNDWDSQWVIQIRQTLDEELEDDSDRVCIFNVPRTLMSSDPNLYTPQQVAIGPYHYWRPELYDMEGYKVAAAKRIQKQFESLGFQNLVRCQLKTLELRIRACYHNYLGINGETLAWMMAIDASFLLEFLQMYGIKDGEEPLRVSSRMSHLIDFAGMKSAHNTILRDVIMLENQIPLFVLRKILEFQLSSQDEADDMLRSMLVGFCKELSPFKMMRAEGVPEIIVSDSAHLLDVLYNMIVPRLEEPSEITQVNEQPSEINQINDQNVARGEEPSEITEVNLQDVASGEEPSEITQVNQQNVAPEGTEKSFMKKTFDNIWKLLSKIKINPASSLTKLPVPNYVKVVLNTLWEIFSFQNKEGIKPENDSSSSNNKPPLVEEITIPSATELYKSGVHFSPINGSISAISFDAKTVTLYLPTISLDLNTEVALRNLVAYEASNASGQLVFTRYIELINGIIDTGKDVKLLREKGMILNRLKSDEEVANMFNGMSKSIKLTKVPFLDKVIGDVNKYYNSRWKVKAKKLMKRYVYASWRLLSLISILVFLLLMALQSFCSVRSCSRIHIYI